MSATVGAALKKVAVALLSDTRILKKVAIFILSVLVGILMPMAAVLGIFTGKIDIDKDDIENAMDSDKVAYYQRRRVRTSKRRSTSAFRNVPD